MSRHIIGFESEFTSTKLIKLAQRMYQKENMKNKGKLKRKSNSAVQEHKKSHKNMKQNILEAEDLMITLKKIPEEKRKIPWGP